MRCIYDVYKKCPDAIYRMQTCSVDPECLQSQALPFLNGVVGICQTAASIAALEVMCYMNSILS